MAKKAARKPAKKAIATTSPPQEVSTPVEEQGTPYEKALRRIESADKSGDRVLDLIGLGLEEVPEAIAKCTRIQLLDLSLIPLKRIPESILSLKQLEHLLLDRTQIESLPPSFGQLQALRTLSLSGNAFSTLPNTLTQCSRLTDLYLDQNRFTSLPLVLEHLDSLTLLDLGINLLTGSLEGLQHLRRLKQLRLHGCGLTSLPEIFSAFPELEALHLQDNQLTQLPASLASCKKLRRLVISDNRLTSLPRFLQELPRLSQIYLHDNPELNLPAEVLGPTYDPILSAESSNKTQATDLLRYYFRLADGQSRPLNEVKLLLVGRGKAGKSSLRDRLVHNTFDEHKPETPGIDIQPWELHCHGEDLRLHVWDFAGQEITHATHQFFLTERSVYLLVLEGRTDNQDRDAEYWLRLISTFGKDSPIIVVLNQWDERPFEVDRNLLQERYPTIRAFIPTDCKSERGIDALRKQLHVILRDLKEVHEPFPASWWSVKEHFSAAQHNYLPFTQFRTICKKQGLKKADEQGTLARILHALGIILHYGEDERLKDTTVLNPQWVTNGVYRLLRLKEKEGQDTDGTLTLAEAGTALPEEPKEMVRYLIELMRRFELCYALDEAETRWLIPQVLTRYQPKLAADWTTAPATRLRYTYKVIPEGLLPRFIVRTHPLSEKRERWRNGVVLEYASALALVKADPTEHRITVTAQGPEADRLRLIVLIRSHFQAIHHSLSALQPREEMEVAGHPGTYAEVRLLEMDERQRLPTTIPTDRGSVPIDQAAQLNLISAPLNRQPDRPSVRVFVSYSQRDTRHLDVFKQNLEIMEMNGLITTWFDGLIKTGSEWDRAIRQELEEADIIIFMVSTSFLASKYIRGVEMARAIQRKEAGTAEIVPLILEPDCSWKTPHQLKLRGTQQTITCDLKKYQALHPKNRNVTRWPTKPNAFNHVEKALTKLREDILAKRAASEAPGK